MTQLDRLARWVHAGDHRALYDWADEHLARRKRQRVKKAPSRADKRKRTLAKWERTAAIRSALVERASGLCEACGGPGVDMHHLLSGNGSRRALEALDTVILLCRGCHDAVHRKNVLPVYTQIVSKVTWGQLSAPARDAILARMEKATG